MTIFIMPRSSLGNTRTTTCPDFPLMPHPFNIILLKWISSFEVFNKGQEYLKVKK